MMARALIAALSIVLVNATATDLTPEESAKLQALIKSRQDYEKLEKETKSAKGIYIQAKSLVDDLRSQLQQSNKSDDKPLRDKLAAANSDLTEKGTLLGEAEKKSRPALESWFRAADALEYFRAMHKLLLRKSAAKSEPATRAAAGEKLRQFFKTYGEIMLQLEAVDRYQKLHYSEDGEQDSSRQQSTLRKTEYESSNEIKLYRLGKTGLDVIRSDYKEGEHQQSIRQLIEAVKKAAETWKEDKKVVETVVDDNGVNTYQTKSVRPQLFEALQQSVENLLDEMERLRVVRLPTTKVNGNQVDGKEQDIAAIIRTTIGGADGEVIADAITESTLKKRAKRNRASYLYLLGLEEGRAAQKRERTPKRDEIVSAPIVDDTDNSVAKPDASKAKKDNDDKGSNNKLVIGLIVAAVVFVLAGVGAFFYFRRT